MILLVELGALPAQGLGAAAPTPPPADAGPSRVQGTVSLAEGQSAPGTGRLFIYARRAATGGGPPIAAVRRSSSELPLSFSISDADMMLGGAWPDQFWVQARIDADGNAATRGEGDLESTVIGPLSVGAQDVALVLGGSLKRECSYPETRKSLLLQNGSRMPCLM